METRGLQSTDWSEPALTKSRSDNLIDREGAFYAEDYDGDHGKSVVPVWPTRLGKKEDEVSAECLAGLQKSPAYDNCKGNFDEKRIVSNCVADVQVG